MNSHIHSFFKAKILSDQLTFSTSPVVDTVREIFTDVDLTVWICDFVDNLAITMHIDTLTKRALYELPTLENVGQYSRSCLVKSNNSKQERGIISVLG